MLVSLKWLNQYVRIEDLDPQDLADLISLHSVEVESVQKVSDATGVVVGYVEKREQHPDADKLSVCQVNLGAETVQIVCGAKNVDAGQKVPVATNGAVLPGGFKIKKTKLRGQESNGMICSASELGIVSSAVPDAISEGIWVLPEDAPTGACAISYLGLDDTIIELGLTPNRMDMLSMYGVANDVAAILDRDVSNFPKSEQISSSGTPFSVTLETEKCFTYLGKVVEGITVKPSSHSVQMQLMRTENKPINNIVDLTNSMMLQVGLPIHAFDADKLPSKEIVVREAKSGETVITLDEQERKLEEGDIVITSGDKIIAIAGVMGSASSAVDEQTTTVLFEAALFDPTQIRKTASRLNLRTNASARFEKGIHLDRVFEANHLIDEAFMSSRAIAVGNFEAKPVEIEVTYSDVNHKLGTDFHLKELDEIFKRLNLDFHFEDGCAYTVTPSTRMLDVTHKHDLIEEIARIHGFNNILATLPAMNTIGGFTQEQKAIRHLHQASQAAGFQNVVTYSLINDEKMGDFLPIEEGHEACVSLSMPLSLDHAHLRKSLIPSLLEVARYNKARQIKDIFIYEIGKVHFKDEEIYTEKTVISGAISGEVITSKWQSKVDKVDFYYAKGAVDTLVSTLGFEATYAPIAEGYKDFHPGQTARVIIGGTEVGVVGKLHPHMKKAYELNDTFVFELNLEGLLSFKSTDVNYVPVSKYPGIAFDIAVISEEILPVSALVDTIKKAGGKLLKFVEVFDIYKGVGVEEGKKSVAINLYYQDTEKTLTDDDINPVHRKVLKMLEKEHGATLRA